MRRRAFCQAEQRRWCFTDEEMFEEMDEEVLTTKKETKVPVPKDYLLAPFFAAKPQSGPRIVQMHSKIYHIGVDPFNSEPNRPAFDTRHGRALVALLSFREPGSTSRISAFSLSDFAYRYANSNGGRYRRDLKKILSDWTQTWITAVDPVTQRTVSYKALKDATIIGKLPKKSDASVVLSGQQALSFDRFELTDRFSELLNDLDQIQHIKLEELNSIRSPLAQAIYWFIPSRAYHHKEADPFQISVGNLLNQVSFPVPSLPSRRKQLFTQHGDNSILSQLDGKKTLSGTFRIRLRETSDGKDWKLESWVEEERVPARSHGYTKGPLLELFEKRGGTVEDYFKLAANPSALEPHEVETLRRAKVNIEGSEQFLRMSKSILGPARFGKVVSEAKADAVEGRKPKRTETARCIDKIMREIESSKVIAPQALREKAPEVF